MQCVLDGANLLDHKQVKQQRKLVIGQAVVCGGGVGSSDPLQRVLPVELVIECLTERGVCPKVVHKCAVTSVNRVAKDQQHASPRKQSLDQRGKRREVHVSIVNLIADGVIMMRREQSGVIGDAEPREARGAPPGLCDPTKVVEIPGGG